jgi:hypothetical protein
MTREETRRRFADGDTWFATSPLYRELSRAVAADDDLLDLAARSRSGQQPANMLMAAVHLLVLKDPSSALAAFYPSVVGHAAQPPGRAAAPFRQFCEAHLPALEAILQTRLVQTNVPNRGVAVRLGMREAARRTDGRVFFLEVGPSAGIQLLFDRWAVELGGRHFGPDPAPLTLAVEWRSSDPVPDLDDQPTVVGRIGVDLNPVDAGDSEERLWLKALVWPEHRARMAQLEQALAVVAAHPPRILAGDAIELLPSLGSRIPDTVPLVVFHAMVRIHVEESRQEAFDRAIEGLAARRRLLHVSLEAPGMDRPQGGSGHLLRFRDSAGEDVDLARADGHCTWIESLV